MPTAIDTTRPTRIDQSGVSVGSAENAALIAARHGDPDDDADDAAEQRERHASVRNWPTMSRRNAPTRLADADLARPLRDRDEHDVHDADAADERAR